MTIPYMHIMYFDQYSPPDLMLFFVHYFLKSLYALWTAAQRLEERTKWLVLGPREPHQRTQAHLEAFLPPW
jgi:hypothetical protein